MSRIRFDQLAKQYLEGCLEPLGQVQRQFEVPGESKFVDVWFTPASASPSPTESLGVLNRLALTACLLEPFRKAPTRSEIRGCLLKVLWIQEEHRRTIVGDDPSTREAGLPRLWILAARVDQPVVQEAGGQLRADWGQGFYFLPEILKAAIVAINELPETEDTLWLRILGRGQVQQQAIAELLNLSKDDPRRSRVLQLLVSWRVTMTVNELDLEEEGEGLMAALSQAYLEWEEATKQIGRQEGERIGKRRGRKAGRKAGERSLVLRQLVRRVGALPEAVRSQISHLSLSQLEALGDALLDFTKLEDLVNWLQSPPTLI